MNRLEILLLDRKNGVIAGEYIDVQSVLGYFHRSGHINRFQIVARRGERALFIDHVDIATIAKKLSDFAIERQQ